VFTTLYSFRKKSIVVCFTFVSSVRNLIIQTNLFYYTGEQLNFWMTLPAQVLKLITAHHNFIINVPNEYKKGTLTLFLNIRRLSVQTYLTLASWRTSRIKYTLNTVASGLYYKTITIVIDAPSVVKSDAPNCSVTYW